MNQVKDKILNEVTFLRKKLNANAAAFEVKKKALSLLVDRKQYLQERIEEIKISTAYEVSVEEEDGKKKDEGKASVTP